MLLSQFIFDSFDVIIWDYTGSIALNNYTFFDKIFDTYQLLLMAIVVFRWPDKFPRKAALSIFTFRLFGFILYEITKKRILFFLFPNLFGLYYLGYYLVRRLKKKAWYTNPKYLPFILALIFILKFPQEYVLHFAEIPTWTIIKQFLGLRN